MVRSAHPTGAFALVAAGFSLRGKWRRFPAGDHRPEACATYTYYNSNNPNNNFVLVIKLFKYHKNNY